MKDRVGYLFWILILAFGLMILVVATQLLTNRNIDGLKNGNREAAITFTINNRLQDLVNLSFELHSKVISETKKLSAQQSLIDSLTMLGYNAVVLQDINLNKEVTTQFRKLNNFIDLQIKMSMTILQENLVASQQNTNSLRKMHLTDSIYATALSIQKYLEKDLEYTLGNNTKTSGTLLAYNKALAFIAIGAVLILGTIIINRHLKQVQLIKDLEKATEAATKSAMVKDQFLANMSHEIRTPLNAIKGFSKLLSKTALNSEQQEFSSIIDEASGNLLKIVNDILDISKIEAGKFRLNVKEFNLTKVIKAIEYLFINAVAEKGLKFVLKIDEDVPNNLLGDPDRISQVLINLINNAIKFTTEGFVKTSISKLKDEGDLVWIKMDVEDSGIGIEYEKQQQIFQRFEQLHTGKDNIFHGTGLGLSIVKNLLGQMGGSISVSSEVGKGSLFSVLLPMMKIVNLSIDNVSNFKELQPLRNYIGAKVLLVEDNKVNQLLLKHTFTLFDINLDITANGQDAIYAIQENNYDLVLLDIQMPVMDGYETIKQIRKAGFTLPVIAMTAYVLPGERNKCLEAGMNDYLTKPIDFRLLTNCLEIYLKEKIKGNAQLKPQELSNDAFLLELFGGDTNMVARLLTEIKNEIPSAKEKLRKHLNSNDKNSISNTSHYLISTFSPLGDNTEIMKKLKQLKDLQQEKVDMKENDFLIKRLIEDLDHLESDLSLKQAMMV